MRTCAKAILAAVLGLAAGAGRADEAADRLAAQRKAAEEAWAAVDAGPGTSVETKNLLIWAPKSSEARVKAIGALLEKYLDSALKTLGLEPKDLPAGKITVYLFPEREQVTTFIRRVEKRRPESGVTGSYSADDDRMHVSASPTAGKVPFEIRAGEELAALLLARRAGKGTSIPTWVSAGFGRANTYRILPRDRLTLADAKQVKALAKSRKPSDLWAGDVAGEEADALQGSVVEFLAFGPAAKYFSKFIDGFKPGEGKLTVKSDEALTSAGLSGELVDKRWKSWAA
jgi:hypothetical protein